MSGVGAPAGIGGAVSGTARPALLTILTAPAGLSQLQAGSRATWTVTTVAANGTVDLATPFGTATARATVPLAAGDTLHLVLRGSRSRLHFSIVAAGHTPRMPPAPSPALPTPSPAAPAQPVFPETARASAAAAMPPAAQNGPGIDSLYTLASALDDVARAHPAPVADIRERSMPRPDSGMAARLLLLLAAIRGGGVRAWIGEGAMRRIQDRNPEAADRLARTFANLSSAADGRALEWWREWQLPLLSEGSLHPVRLLVRRRGRGKGGDAQTPEADPEAVSERFVLEARLRRIGRLQLDGLVRNRRSRLDLLIRTEQPLPAHHQDGIRSVFAEAAAASGIGGTVTFRSQPADFAEVPGGCTAPRLPATLLA